MAAALHALKIYTRDVSNCWNQVKFDNTSSLAWINKKTAPNEAIFLILKEFWGYGIIVWENVEKKTTKSQIMSLGS